MTDNPYAPPQAKDPEPAKPRDPPWLAALKRLADRFLLVGAVVLIFLVLFAALIGIPLLWQGISP